MFSIKTQIRKKFIGTDSRSKKMYKNTVAMIGIRGVSMILIQHVHLHADYPTLLKITNPGLKKVYRIYDENKKAIADLIAGADEVVDLSKPYRYVDPVKPWKNRYFENCTAVELQQLVVKNGKRVMDRVSIDEIKKYVQDQLTDNIWEEEQRFENPHNHYLDMSPAYYDMKMSLLHKLTD